MRIMVCGGAGYIGSHTCVELIAAGHDVVILDNFSNSSREVIKRIEHISGRSVHCVEMDIRSAGLDAVLLDQKIDGVIHFAAYKAVAESVVDPLKYYDNNVLGTILLLKAMERTGVPRLVFSSSATVYGEPTKCPVAEDAPLSAVNPYGRTKLIVEQILADIDASSASCRIAVLRYFNPVGAHESGMIGEDPRDTPNNLMPYISRVAVGQLPYLNVFGKDYPTRDGTGIRDYIHVVDLAKAHVAAIERTQAFGSFTVNLGTGRGHSVLEVVSAYERACGRKLPLEFRPRRDGDAAECYADPSLARRLLGWNASRDLDAMCIDAWRWQSRNPNGYRDCEDRISCS